jgi:putative endonuclease
VAAKQEGGYVSAYTQTPNPRVLRGKLAYRSGQAAEMAVLSKYVGEGYVLLEHRWRGKAGEIDLIFEKDACFVFVEVKSSKTCAIAAQSLSPKQLSRICLSAQDYAGQSERGALSDVRIDVALVDAQGVIETIENVTL